MKVVDVKILTICMMPILTGICVTCFFYSDIKADVYLFYNHSRYLDNIFYDITNLLTSTILSFYASKWKKNIFAPFFYASLLQWVLYFTFYKQMSSLVVVPFLIFLILLYNYKRNE